MYLVSRYEDLEKYEIWNNQHWYYVFLMNAKDLTVAGEKLLANLNILHLESGENCDFFIPGFNPFQINDIQNNKYGHIQGIGELDFDDQKFVDFYKQIENHADNDWSYSGGCILLLFTVKNHKIDLTDFFDYNLDDIVRNGRTISEFLLPLISASKKNLTKNETKYLLDEKYYELVIPETTNPNNSTPVGLQIFNNTDFVKGNYYFLSYSSKDWKFVTSIKQKMEANGHKCWMAPYDIPRGTSYPEIIEYAISNADKFILMLSENVKNSVWVNKELCRAINKFQIKTPEKICVAWVNEPFSLDGTKYALPLEDIQWKVVLKNNPDLFILIFNEQRDSNTVITKKDNDFSEENKNDEEEKLKKVDDLEKIVLEEYSIENRSRLAISYKELGTIYYDKDNDKTCLYYLKAFKIWKQLNEETEDIEIKKNLSDIVERLEGCSRKPVLYSKFMEYSLYNTEILKQIYEIQGTQEAKRNYINTYCKRATLLSIYFNKYKESYDSAKQGYDMITEMVEKIPNEKNCESLYYFAKCIADSSKSLERFEEAETYYLKCIDIVKNLENISTDSNNISRLSYIYRSMAELKKQTAHFDEAKEWEKKYEEIKDKE